MDWKKVAASIGVTGALAVGGIDAAVLNEQPIEKQDITVASETVTLEQKGNIVEAKMPWKGQPGLTVKYDMGEPTAEEALKDKRNKSVVTEKVDFQGSEGFKIDIILEEKPDTNVFCYYIEGWEHYDFSHQPALTEDEIAEGAVRPEEIIGSYAIYHKTLKDHRVGGINYETGKFGHIPFPYVWELNDESTKQRAEDLTFNDGNLCVKVSEKFLAEAEYPVRVDPTFGYSLAGVSSVGGNSTIRGSIFTASGSGTIAKWNIYMHNLGAATIPMKAGIYGSSTSNFVGESVYRTDLGNFTQPRWMEFNASGTASFIDATNYILVSYSGFGSQSASNPPVYYDTVTDAGVEQSLSFTAFPDPATFTGVDRRYSIYVQTGDDVPITRSETFNNAGFTTWTAPDTVTSADIACWGGGGGGGDAANTGGGGGGGGAFASSTVAVTPGTVYDIFIGAGGAGGTSASSLPGANGATTTFATTTVVAAPGWGGGTGNNVDTLGGDGGAVASSTGDVLFAGGKGGRGISASDSGGGGGGSAGPHGAGGLGGTGGLVAGGGGGNGGAAGNSSGVGGASTNGGAGGNSVAGANALAGVNHANGGGGGGGASNGFAGGAGGTVGAGGGGGELGGGNGGDGKCTVTYTIAAAAPADTRRRQSEFFFD